MNPIAKSQSRTRSFDDNDPSSTFTSQSIQSIKEAKKQIQGLLQSLTSVEPENIRDSLRRLSSICDSVVTVLEELGSSDAFEQIPSSILILALKNLRNGLCTLLRARHDPAFETLRRILSNFPLLAFFMLEGDVPVKIAVESMLRSFFNSLTTSQRQVYELLALRSLSKVANPLVRGRLLLLVLQEMKIPIDETGKAKCLIDEMIQSVAASPHSEGQKLADSASKLLHRLLPGSPREWSGESLPRPTDTFKHSSPKIAIHDCRLESTRVRNQKSNKIQLEILVVLDLQCANCDPLNDGVGTCIARQTGLFVREAVLRSKDMRMPVLDELSPPRKRFEAEASMSRKRSRLESSTEGEGEGNEIYAPSPCTKSRARGNASHEDPGQAKTFVLDTFQSEPMHHLALPEPIKVAQADCGTEATHKFEATKSWMSLEDLENIPQRENVLHRQFGDPPYPNIESVALSLPIGVSVSSNAGDASHSGIFTEASSIAFAPPVVPAASDSPTASCSEDEQSTIRSKRQTQSSSVGGEGSSETGSHFSSDDEDKLPSESGTCHSSVAPEKGPLRSHDADDNEDEDDEEEIVSPKSRTLLHPLSPYSTKLRSDSVSSRRSGSSAVMYKEPPRYSHTFADARTSPSPAMCSQSTSRSSRFDPRSATISSDMRTLTAVSPARLSPGMKESSRPPSFVSRRGFLTPGSSRLAQKTLRSGVSASPTSPSPTSPSPSPVASGRTPFRRQSTITYTSREPFLARQRSRASAASPMSSSILSSSPSMRTPREAETLTPFAVMSSHILSLIVTCLGDCTNLGTSRSSSAVNQRSMDMAAAPLSADTLREELELHDASDPFVIGLMQAKTRGGVWLVHHHILQALRRISFFHPDALEQYTQLSSLYLLLAKSMECLRSSISRKALAVTKDFYTPANSLRRRVLDTGVAHMLPACLKKASDQSNLFLADAAVNAYEAIVQTASETACMSTLKPLINTAMSSGQRWHVFRATSLVCGRLQGRIITINDIDKVIAFAVKGLRDASSESRFEARNLCASLSRCFEVASPLLVNRLRAKVRAEDWVRLTEKH